MGGDAGARMGGASVSNSGLFGATPRVIGISVCADDGEDFVGPRWFRPLTTSGTLLGPEVYAEERLGDSRQPFLD